MLQYLKNNEQGNLGFYLFYFFPKFIKSYTTRLLNI